MSGGLVLGCLLPSLTSLAVIVQVPGVLLVTLKIFVPEIRAVLAGKKAFGSVQVIPMVSPIVVTTFQFASTALTVTL